MKSLAISVCLLAAALFAASAAAPVFAATSACSDCHFGARPGPGAPGPGSYFAFSLAAGRSFNGQLEIQNQESKPQTLAISTALGQTATNSGSAYAVVAGPCQGPTCWLAGFPDRITIPANQSVLVPFTVHVPAGTSAGQYLAGLAVTPAAAAAAPTPTQAATKNAVGINVTVRYEVIVGVAVTVGDASSLHPALAIGGVTSNTDTPDVRANIALRNTGNTFLKAQGTLTIDLPSGATHYTVNSDTILPGQQAQFPVSLPSVSPGSYHASLELTYAPGTAPATWSGSVVVAAHQAAPSFVTDKQGATRVEYAPSASSGTATWQMAALGAAGALLLVLCAGTAFFVYRRPRAA